MVADLRRRLAADPPDVILNATAFSARLDDGSSVFDACDAPVFQVAVSLANEAQWRESSRGLAPSDLAMNVALPEVDGRLFAGAISFKAADPPIRSLEYAPLLSRPNAENIAHAARLAAAWAALRNARRRDRNASPSCCRTILARAGARAMRSGSTRSPRWKRSPNAWRARATGSATFPPAPKSPGD